MTNKIMKKKFAFLILVFFTWQMLKGQSFIRILEMDGVELSSDLLYNLDEESRKLDSLIKSDNINNDFKVFDAGLYIYNNIMANPEEFFDEIDSKINCEYHLVIKRQMLSNGNIYVKAKLKLPASGRFSCLTPDDIANYENLIVNICSSSELNNLYENVLDALKFINTDLINSTSCCSGNRSVASFGLDPEDFEIKFYFPGKNEIPCIQGFCWGKPISNNTELYLDFNNSVNLELGIEVLYKGFYTSCTNISFGSKITYRKPSIEKDFCLKGFPFINEKTFNISTLLLNPNKSKRYYIRLLDLEFGGETAIYVFDNIGNVLDSVKFLIKGINPKVGLVMKYVDSKEDFNHFWWYKKMIIKESSSIGKKADDLIQHFGYKKGGNGHIDEKGFPLVTSDCGCGLTQLTTNVSIGNIRNVWFWKNNIDRNVELMDDTYYWEKIKKAVREELIKISE